MERSQEETAAPFLSLIVPAYNEGARLAGTLRDVTTYLAAQPYTWELLVVDDGSTDDTLAIAEAAARDHGCGNLRVIANPHRGKAYAIRSGILLARGEIAGFTDADLATPIAALADALRPFDEGYDVVVGSREGIGAIRRGEPAYRHVMGRIFNRLVQLVALPGIEDSQCGFKLFRGPVAHDLFRATRLYHEKSRPPRGAAVTAFDVEILFLARRRGHRIAVLPVEWRYGSESKVDPLRDSARNLRDVLMVRLNSWLGRYR